MIYKTETSPVGKTSREYYENKANEIFTAFSKSNYYLNFMSSTIRWNFYNNNQWIIQEDNDTFLMDETNDTRNRVKFTMNIIEPLVKFLVGNTIRTDFSYTAVNLSPKAWARREEKLRSAKHITAVGQHFPEFQEALEKEFNVGKNTEETVNKFNRYYTDEYRESINCLIDNVSEQENFEELKNKIGLSFAVDGIGIVKDYFRNGRHKFKRIFLKNYIWDTSAVEPDHSDAAFQGDWWMMKRTDMLESYSDNMDEDTRKMLSSPSVIDLAQLSDGDNLTGEFMRFTPFNDKHPVFEFCWEEAEVCWYGCVIDEFGYEIFTKIDGEIYTDNDLVFPEIPFHVKIMNGKSKIKRYPTVGKYVIVTPRYVSGNTNADDKASPVSVLEYGDVPYTESSVSRNGSHSPYNVYCLNYYDGIVHSPLDSLISPQRFINRLISMGESASNNWRPSGTIIDEDAIAGSKDQLEDIQANINKGKVVTVRANGQLNNVIGTYGSNMGDVTSVMLNTASMLNQMVSSGKGINESMTGTVGGYRVSSSAVMSNIQQGSLMQEDFFFAISQVFYRLFNKIATRGKLCYIDNETELTKITGDGYAKILTLSKDLENEDIRIYIKRAISKEQQIKSGNELLFILRQSQLIDDDTFAMHFGVSDVDQVTRGLFEYNNRLAEAKEKAAKEAEAKQPAMLQAQQDLQDAEYTDRDMDRQVISDNTDKKTQTDLMKTMLTKTTKEQPTV